MQILLGEVSYLHAKILQLGQQILIAASLHSQNPQASRLS